MRVILLGTGCPPADVSRYGPSALVRGARARILVDCGSGVTQRALAAGCPGRDIDVLLLTHLHTDHVIDLYQLIMTSWHAGRDAAQRIIGPVGTQRFVQDMMALWQREREARIAHELRPSIRALDVEVEEIADGAEFDIEDVHVRAVGVDHRPVKHALGFVFSSDDGRVAISGDTTYCPALIAAARGVDVLVHEVFMHHEMTEAPGVRSAQGIERVASYHTLSDVVGRVAHEAQARCLMLTHFVPPRFDRERLLAQVRSSYAGPILIGEDLMSFDTADRSVSCGDALLNLGQ